ncbi:MAG: T9SS type A sorting domain-containing protein [Candidatus Zixiibacteriota bacterium]
MKKRIETLMVLIILVLVCFILGCKKPDQYYFATDPSGFGIYYIKQDTDTSCTQACLQGFEYQQGLSIKSQQQILNEADTWPYDGLLSLYEAAMWMTNQVYGKYYSARCVYRDSFYTCAEMLIGGENEVLVFHTKIPHACLLHGLCFAHPDNGGELISVIFMDPAIPGSGYNLSHEVSLSEFAGIMGFGYWCFAGLSLMPLSGPQDSGTIFAHGEDEGCNIPLGDFENLPLDIEGYCDDSQGSQFFKDSPWPSVYPDIDGGEGPGGPDLTQPALEATDSILSEHQGNQVLDEPGDPYYEYHNWEYELGAVPTSVIFVPEKKGVGELGEVWIMRAYVYFENEFGVCMVVKTALPDYPEPVFEFNSICYMPQHPLGGDGTSTNKTKNTGILSYDGVGKLAKERYPDLVEIVPFASKRNELFAYSSLLFWEVKRSDGSVNYLSPFGDEMEMDNKGFLWLKKESSPQKKTSIPASFSLRQNYPNPFNLSTEIEYSLPKDAHVRLVIYNVLGQKVRTLVNEYKSVGTYTIAWDGSNDNGSVTSSGIYFYKLVAGEYTQTKKMVMLK